MDIGERVRSLRKGKGMTQDDLADEVGLVDQIYISRLETGRLKNVRPEVLRALSTTFGVSVDYLLLGDEGADKDSGKSEKPIQQFIMSFMCMPPAKQSQVMDFTAFIDKKGEKGSEEPSGDS